MPKQSKKRKPAESSKPKGMVMVTSPIRPDVQFYVAAEQADDSLIEQEMMGNVLPTMIYEFQQDGKPVKGLTVSGVREVARRLNRNSKSGHKIRISPEPPIIQHDLTMNGQKGVQVMVYAEDLQTGGGQWGSKFEPYVKVSKRGAYEDKFAFEKALSKAQRNAMRALIPEKLAIELISNMIKEGAQVQRLEPPKGPAEAKMVQVDATDPAKLYDAVVRRIEALAGNKRELEAAKGKIENMPFTEAQKSELIKLIEISLMGL